MKIITRFFLFLSFLCGVSGVLQAQSVQGAVSGHRTIPDSLALQFRNQLTLFPQEKIYLHIDKPYYAAGERIWFRAYLLDAMAHTPAGLSRYVYVDLIDPLDSIVARVKIRPEEYAYHGSLSLSPDLPQGDYNLRAYTFFMQNQDENYFFNKSIRIGSRKKSSVETGTEFFFENGQKVHATFRFSDSRTSSSVVPQSAKVRIGTGKPMKLAVDNDGTATVNFELPAASRRRVIVMEIEEGETVSRQFIDIPFPDDEFDVSFFP